MLTVYKYQLYTTPGLHLPTRSEVLDIGLQGEWVYVWALVDTEYARLAQPTLLMVGTGQPLGEDARDCFKHVRTLHTPLGMVWHIFQRKTTL